VSIMAELIKSRWHLEAARRWPERRILGDGNFAVLTCGNDLRLTDNESFARGLQFHDSCNNQGTCKHTHTLFNLNPESFTSANRFMKHTADSRERDRR
jgi:hypothetical protein